MIVYKNTFSLPTTIVAMGVKENTLALITTEYVYFEYNIETFELLVQKSLIKDAKEIHPYAQSFAISTQLDIALNSSKNGKGKLLNLNTHPLVNKTYMFNNAPVYVAKFNQSGTLLGLGGEDGKFFLYDLKTLCASSLINTNSDFISAIAFSPNGKYLSVSSFNKITTIFDIQKYTQVDTFKVNEAAIEDAVFSNDSKKVLFSTRERYLYSYDIATLTTTKSKFEIDGWASALAMIGKDHCIVATRSASLYLINYENMTIIQSLILPKVGVTGLCVHNNLIIVSMFGGDVIFIDLIAYEQEISIHLKLHEFKQATEYLKENIFLMTQPIIDHYNKYWPEVLEEAKWLLLQNKKAEALKRVEPFFFDEKKKEEFRSYLFNFSDYAIFIMRLNNKQYIEAYHLCMRNPWLEGCTEYTVLERAWQKLYNGCKILLSVDNADNINEVHKRLRPYSTIAKKNELISSLLINYRIFNQADILIKQHDFKNYFQLLKEYSFLSEDIVYDRVIEIGKRMLTKLQTLEKEWKLNEALEVAQYLTVFLPLQETVLERIILIEKKIKLEKFIKTNNILSVYSQIETSPALELTPIFKKYHQIFLDKITDGEKYVTAGNPELLIELLSDYLPINYTKNIIKYFLKKAYINEIINAWEKKYYSIDWGKTFNTFYNYFGIDNDFMAVALAKGFDILDISFESYTDHPMDEKQVLVYGKSILTIK